MKSIHPLLESLGFSLQESQVYTELLQLGTTIASSLSKRLNINRSTTKYTLENLRKKGLVFVVKKNNTYYYTAEEPERILLMFREEEQKLERKKGIAQKIVGPLNAMKNKNAFTPEVQWFEGDDHFIAEYIKVVKNAPKGSHIDSYAIPGEETNQKRYKKMLLDFDKYQKKKNISINSMIINARMAELIIDNDDTNTQYKYFDKRDIEYDNLQGEIFFTVDSMHAFFVHDQKTFVFIIKHKGLISMYRHLFSMAWKFLEYKE